MFGLFARKPSEFQEFSSTEEEHLTALFRGFPPGTLAAARILVNVEVIKRDMFNDKNTSTEECAAMLAKWLVGEAVDQLLPADKQAVGAAWDARDMHNPLCFGVGPMMDTAEKLVNSTHARLISYEFVGNLRGMSRKEIDDWWCGDELRKIFHEHIPVARNT
jgi:hypothetical protein